MTGKERTGVSVTFGVEVENGDVVVPLTGNGFKSTKK